MRPQVGENCVKDTKEEEVACQQQSRRVPRSSHMRSTSVTPTHMDWPVGTSRLVTAGARNPIITFASIYTSTSGPCSPPRAFHMHTCHVFIIAIKAHITIPEIPSCSKYDSSRLKKRRRCCGLCGSAIISQLYQRFRVC